MIYIAYGSNINLRQMARRCPGAKIVGPAELYGYDLLFKGRRFSAAATVEPLKGGVVPVLLWQINKMHEQSLDGFEGWPNVYRKEVHRVKFEGKTRQGMLYVMNDAYFGIPSAPYYTTIRDGYKSAGFDTSYLDRAVTHSMRIAREQDQERYEQELAAQIDEEIGFDDCQQRFNGWW